MNRRRFLKYSLQMGGALAVARYVPHSARSAWAAGLSRPLGAPAPFPTWGRYARIADAYFDEGEPAADMQLTINKLKKQNVSVIEVDTILSNWLPDAQFTAHMADVQRFVGLAHSAGLSVVMYYPSLEVISIGGETGPSFYKNGGGAEWVQRSLDGQPNVFYGSLVFWVDPGDESCWVSPNSGWRDYYLGRIKQLAATGIDGIWPDVPIYFNGQIEWCDASQGAKDAFKQATGYDIPTSANFNDPIFRRYIEWRHRNLNQWQIDIANAGRSVNPNLFTFCETVTMDYQDSTAIGLDGAYLRQAEGVSQVWEVDILDLKGGMRKATANDWVCMIAMYKYARAASGTKPAWAFSYGWSADDAALVMGEVLATGCNPFEVKSPEKTTSVNTTMRTRMFAFAKLHQARIFDARSLANVAVYHSSASRDYVKPTAGNGMYANARVPSGSTRSRWWSSGDLEQTCTRQQWLGEYRGTLKALIYAHIPWNVLTSPGLSQEDLAGYRVLMLPDLEAISDGEAAIIKKFVQDGGTIIITGPNPSGLSAFGDARPEYALADVLGFTRATTPTSKQNPFGAGQAIYFADLPGLQYLSSQTQAAYDKLINAVKQAAPPFVTVQGDPRIHLEAGSLGNEIILHLTNFTMFGSTPGTFTITTTTCTVTVAVPAGKQVTSVQVSASDVTTPALAPLAYSVANGQLSFQVSISKYALVVITTA